MAQMFLIATLVLAVVFQGFEIATLALIVTPLFCAVAAGLLAGHGRGLVVRGRLVTLLVVLLGAWLLAAAGLGVAPRLAVLACYQLAVLPLAYVAYFLCPDRERLWRQVTVVLFGLCVLLALYSLYETQIALRPLGRTFFVQPNSLSGYLLPVVFVLAAELCRNLRRGAAMRGRCLALAAAVYGGMFVIGYTTSRASLGALGIGTLAFYVVLGRDARVPGGRLVVALALWAVLGANVVTGGTVRESVATMVTASSAFRFDDLSIDLAGQADLSAFGLSKLQSANQRIVLWKNIAALLPATPWHGFGPGSFRLVYPRFSSAEDLTSQHYAHNDYLQFYIELGVPGVALIAAIMLWVTRRVQTAMRIATGGARDELAGLFAALTAVAADSFFSYDFYVVATLVLVGLVLVRFVDRVAAQADGWVLTPHRHLRRPVFAAAAVAVCAAPLALLGSAFLMSVQYARGMEQLVAGNLAAAERDLNLAAVLYDTAHVQVARAQVYLAALDASRDPAQRAGFFTRARDSIARAAEMGAHLPAVPFARGLIAQRDAALAPAERDRRTAAEFAAALGIDARFFPARLELARILYDRNRKPAALAALEHGLRIPFAMDPAMLEYVEFARDLRAELGDARGAGEIAARIAVLKQLWDRT